MSTAGKHAYILSLKVASENQAKVLDVLGTHMGSFVSDFSPYFSVAPLRQINQLREKGFLIVSRPISDDTPDCEYCLISPYPISPLDQGSIKKSMLVAYLDDQRSAKWPTKTSDMAEAIRAILSTTVGADRIDTWANDIAKVKKQRKYGDYLMKAGMNVKFIDFQNGIWHLNFDDHSGTNRTVAYTSTNS